MLCQFPSPELPAQVDATPLTDAKTVHAFSFERTSDVKGAGGILRDKETGYGFHITGTDANRRCIGTEVVDRFGNKVPTPVALPKFLIADSKMLISMFDLELEPGSAQHYTRPGYEGRYTIRREPDGTVALFFGGGRHESNLTIPPQTFHHGFWDQKRREESATSTVQATTRDLTLPPPKVGAVAPNIVAAPPVTAESWAHAVKSIAAAVTAKDHGIKGGFERRDFCAVFYEGGAVTNSSRDYPRGDSDGMIPNENLSQALRVVQQFTSKTPDQSANIALRASHARGAVAVRDGERTTYLFRTESSTDGTGVVLLDGSPGSLPELVANAYAAAARAGHDGHLDVKQWHLVDADSELYGMVRANGQVIFARSGEVEAEMFDPLQAILLNARHTRALGDGTNPAHTTLQELYTEKSAVKFRKVVWDGRGCWNYTTKGVPTIALDRDEPPAPSK